MRTSRFARASIALALAWSSLAGCGPASYIITPVSGRKGLQEHVVDRQGAFPTAKIAVVELEGVISNARGSNLLGGVGDNPVASFKERLDQAADDPRVRAVVLRINSPGGGVTASDLMYAEVQAFRKRTGKPVVASMLDVAASGGYYVACAADEIFAAPTSVTGSIGVIMIAPDFSGTMQKLGIRANVIKSGELKDAGSPLREMTAADRERFQQMIDAMHARFVDVVAAGRGKLSREQVRTLADGRVYLAQEALAAGLVDAIGTPADAIEAAKVRCGLKGPAVVVAYARAYEYRPNVYAQAPARVEQVNLINVDLGGLLDAATPQFLYLWDGR